MKLKSKLLADYYIGGSIHVLITPLVFLLGKVLRRDHSLERIEDVTIIKMLGGGSLVIAYPSLVALKDRYPNLKLRLITTSGIEPFATVLGIFDEIMVIRDSSLPKLALDSVKVIPHIWRTRALIDFEIHSRFSSIFCLLTAAINRIGYYTDISFWRKSLYTHLIFYNKYAPLYHIYDHVVGLFQVQQIEFAPAKTRFKAKLEKGQRVTLPQGAHIGVAPGCSDLSRERMLDADQWVRLLGVHTANMENPVVHFVGGPGDRVLSEAVITKLALLHPKLVCQNLCGICSLEQSISLINQLEVLYCVDSSLIHFGRLCGIKTVSYWGPTDPRMMLRPDPDLQEETNYLKLSCSPCVHIVFEPPCHGNNICMEASLCGEDYRGERNPAWLANYPTKKGKF